MRWLTYASAGSESFGFINGNDEVVDIRAQSDFASLREAIAADALADLANAHASTSGTPLADITYLPPIPQPDKILCAGVNYKAHMEETGREATANPTIFVRFGNAQIGHEAPMIKPPESERLDFEGEIALIIGKAGRRISTADAMSHVAGFSCYNDGSVRDYQRHTTQFTPGKNFVGTGGFGPWMITRDDVPNLADMEVTTRLNGEVMQNAKAELLIFGFEELISYCSTFTELVPGDVIVTGTPGGVGAARTPPVFMVEGDVIEIEVKPIGTLRNKVANGGS